jgi:cytoskeleton protein RodZ
MGSQVGVILRQARNRRKVELVEVEAATRIRRRYLQAIESEEWEVLPGGVYTRGFIRTYAAFLGLDGDRLVEDYRVEVEGAGPAESGPEATPALARPRTAERTRDRRFVAWLTAAGAAVLIGAGVLVLLPGEGGDAGSGSGGQQAPEEAHGDTRREPQAKAQPAQEAINLQLVASAEVWVCLLDARGRPLVDGQILAAGAKAGPFRSGSFTVSFGNGEVSMMVDGNEAEIPATSSPIGYSIDRGGTLTELSEGERPTCA